MTDSAHQLQDISTSWTLLFQSHDGPQEQISAARRFLLDRYSKPVYRYLLASVKDPDSADELYQEFALRFVRGDFRRAHPDQGRFRHYLKRALHHLIVDHFRRRERQPAPLPAEESALADAQAPSAEMDHEFTASWRAELLARTWEALEQFEARTGKPFFTILRCRTEHPELSSEQMVHQLGSKLGPGVNTGWMRKRLHYARDKFTELLLQEVLRTLEVTTREQLEEELQDLGVLEYCRSALDGFSPR